MSKKNKMFRAWIHNYPDDGSERSAFEFGWRNGKKERARLAAENKALRSALERITKTYGSAGAVNIAREALLERGE